MDKQRANTEHATKHPTKRLSMTVSLVNFLSERHGPCKLPPLTKKRRVPVSSLSSPCTDALYAYSTAGVMVQLKEFLQALFLERTVVQRTEVQEARWKMDMEAEVQEARRKMNMQWRIYWDLARMEGAAEKLAAEKLAAEKLAAEEYFMDVLAACVQEKLAEQDTMFSDVTDTTGKRKYAR